MRRKLGVEEHELSNEAIDLVGAYGRFRGQVTSASLDALRDAGDYPALVICDAIEALAAIWVIPALQISLAAKESSGTNQFHRAAIDWGIIRAQLDQYVAEGYQMVDPVLDPSANFGSLLIAVVRPDPVTGESS